MRALDLDRPYVITHDHSNPALWPRPLTAGNVVHNELIRMLGAEGIEVHVTEDVQAIADAVGRLRSRDLREPDP